MYTHSSLQSIMCLLSYMHVVTNTKKTTLALPPSVKFEDSFYICTHVYEWTPFFTFVWHLAYRSKSLGTEPKDLYLYVTYSLFSPEFDWHMAYRSKSLGIMGLIPIWHMLIFSWMGNYVLTITLKTWPLNITRVVLVTQYLSCFVKFKTFILDLTAIYETKSD
jgi:hypothetical protein